MKSLGGVVCSRGGEAKVMEQCIFSEAGSENHWLSTHRVENALGKLEDEGNFYPENISRILDNLLEGYDNRLRPGFGGERYPLVDQAPGLPFPLTVIARPRGLRRETEWESAGVPEIGHLHIPIQSLPLLSQQP